jgi:hypothetical protein
MVNVRDCAGPQLNVPDEGSRCQTTLPLVPARILAHAGKGLTKPRKLGACHLAGCAGLTASLSHYLRSAGLFADTTEQGARTAHAQL